MSPQNQPFQPMDPDSESEYRQLLVFLRDPPKFRLAVAESDVPETRAHIISRATQELRADEQRVVILDFKDTPHNTFLLTRLRQVLDALAPEALAQAIMVINIEATLDYSRGAAVGMATFTNANIQRDAFVRNCPVPVVLWLSRLASAEFARLAPDLWHWRSGSFQFAGQPSEVTQTERRVVDRPLLETGNLLLRGKKEDVNLLLDLLVRLEEAPDRDSPQMMARRTDLLTQLGILRDSLGHVIEAVEYFNRALALAQECGDRQREAYALGNLGKAFSDLGNQPRAIEYLEKQLARVREIGDARGEAHALGNLGKAHALSGELAKAIEYWDRCLARAREIHDRRHEGGTLANLGCAHIELGYLRRGIDSLKQSLLVAQDIGDKALERHSLAGLGTACLRSAETKDAIQYLEKSLNIASELGDRQGSPYASWNLGWAFVQLGELQRAIPLMQFRVDYEREIGHPDAETHAAEVEKLRQRLQSN